MKRLHLHIQTILKRLLLRHRYQDQLMNSSKEQTILLSSISRNKVMNRIRNTIMNLCKFIVDRKVTCKSTRLGKKEESKIRPVKIVLKNSKSQKFFSEEPK